MSEHSVDAVERLYEVSHGSLLRNAEREGHRGIRHGYHDDEDAEMDAAIDRMRRELVNVVGVSADDRVLDVGCGFGEDAAWIADRIGADVVGVNISDRQLDVGRKLADDRGVSSRVSFRADDFHELASVEDASVDVVWGVEALCHAHSYRLVAEQVSRTLTDGGRVVFADLFRSPTAGGSSASLRVASAGLRVNYEPIDALVSQLENAGFVDVESTDATDAIRPSARNYYWYGLVAYPAYRLKSILTRSDADRQLAATARGHRHQYKAIADGELAYSIVSARRPNE